MKQALLLQFTVPGVPVLYYGDEIGMKGGADPESRPDDLGSKNEWDHETFELFKSFVNLEKILQGVSRGQVLGHDRLVRQWCYCLPSLRRRSIWSVQSSLDQYKFRKSEVHHNWYPYSHFYSTTQLVDVLTGKRIENQVSNIIDLEPHEVGVYRPDSNLEALTLTTRIVNCHPDKLLTTDVLNLALSQ